MKAIQVKEPGAPDVMRIAEVPDPRPGPGQVVVRVRAAGVNPVDTYIRSGAYPLKVGLPYTPGIDGAGEIASVGEGVKVWKTGQRCYIAGSLTGTYAEMSLCMAANVHPLPEHVSFSQGAGVNVPYATAYRALFQRANPRPGDMVLVHGASGGVGIAACQLGRAAGLRVIGTASSERGRRLVLENGAHYAADHAKAGYMTEVLNITGGEGVAVILEMLANVNLDHDAAILARNGTVVVIGSRGRVEIDPRNLMSRDANVHGMSLLSLPEEDAAVIHSALAAGLENRTLRPVVGQELPLERAPESHQAVMRPGAYGKIVLVP